MDVSLRSPLTLNLDITNLEERYPSIEFGLELEDAAFGRSLSLRDSIWVEQAVWESFRRDLSTTPSLSMATARGPIAFFDMNDAFRFMIAFEGGNPTLTVTFKRRDACRTASLEVVHRIDDDAFGHIQRAFAECVIGL